MSNTRRLLGIVLDKENCRENDQIIFFYTQEAGKIEILIRGGRKVNSKLAPIVAEPFALIRLVIVPGRNNFHLIGGEVEESFKDILQNEKKIIQINALFKKINKLVKTQSDSKIFPLILKFLERINEQPAEKIGIIISAFLIKFLTFLGYRPEIRRCLICSKIPLEKEIVFNPIKGGIVCLKHGLEPNDETGGIKINQGVLNILQKLLYRDFDYLISQDFDQKDLLAAGKTIKRFFNWHLS